MIHFLARFQFTFIRCRVARIVSLLTRELINPCSKHTSAASASVHTRVSLPKSRGLRCSNARSRSACSAVKAAWVWCGRVERCSNAATPWASNVWMVLRTVFSSHPTTSAIPGTCSLRALAAMIWHRRSQTTSLLRKPAATLACSSTVSSRTYIGVLIHPIVPLSGPSCLCLH